MATFNKVILLGNLVRDPELRVTPKGTAICTFTVAVSRQFKGDGGDTREEVAFVDVTAWGKQAETIQKYCAKGKPLLVEGRLKLDQWDDKATGAKRSKLGVILESFQFVGGKQDDAATLAAKPDAAPPARPADRSQAESTSGSASDSDAPFFSFNPIN